MELENMENEIVKYFIIGLCFLFAEIGGVDIGFQIKILGWKPILTREIH